FLTVTDSGGLKTTTTRDILLRTINVTMLSNPAGLGVTLDGQSVPTPATIGAVSGMIRTLGAPVTQGLNGTTYQFNSWSDGGNVNHDITIATTNITYNVIYTTPHPADSNPADYQMALDEATLYGFCWKSAPTIPSGCP